jgi:N-acetylglucosaminyldiphosphoundecaprenol N-acetyl-beta-D-mannosaminyltransferase
MNSAPDFERDVHCLLGLPIDAIDLAGAERRIRAAAQARHPCFMSTPNVNFLVASRSDRAFRDAVLHSDLSVADGMPLVWLARLLGIPLRERVAGANLFEALSGGSDERRLAVYFFGGPDGVAEAAAQRLERAGKGLVCVGHESPGFGSVEQMSSEETIRRINAANADLLVVSLGARKGQAWIERNRARLNVPVVSHLGAVVDFAAGRIRRAPPWIQRAGLEWLWRIKEQPSLWRRYWGDGLALAILLFTRVLPYVWYVRSRRGQPAEASVEARDTKHVYSIVLRGAWTRANIAVLRHSFSQAVRSGKNVRLEMTAVSHVDSAFVGLVMLLLAYQQQHRRRLAIVAVPSPIRRVLDYCCAEFLCHV